MRILKSLAATALLVAACEQKPATLTLEPATILPLDKKGKTVQLKGQLKDEKGKFISVAKAAWSSSDDSVATVADTGLITAQGSGSAVITAAQEGVTATMPVTVRIIGSLEIEPAGPIKMKMRKDSTIKVTVKDDRGNVMPEEKFLFKNSGYCVEADPPGNIHAQATGECTVIALAGGKEARVSFVVTE